MITHTGSALLILIAGGILQLRRKATGFLAGFVLGWMWQVLLSFPAGLWQSLKGWPHIDVSGSPLWIRFIMTPLVGWPFNAGGFTARYVFEATVEPLEWLVGHRSSTVLSNMPYYAFLLLVQGSILAAIFAWRYKEQKRHKDRFVICLGVLFLINSLLNVTWFWAGT